VQYHVPLWKALAGHPDLDVKVFYLNDQSVRGGYDKDFGLNIAWDVDLLSGYEHEFLSRDVSLDRPSEARIVDIDALLNRERPDWIMISGYTHAFERQLIRAAGKRSIRVLMRGEFSDLSYGERSLPKRIARAAYLRWFYTHVDRFCFIGEGARQHLREHGVDDEQMTFSPYSVDDTLLDRQKSQFRRDQARAELGIPDDRFVFVLSGKLIPRKDPAAVLHALEHLPDLARVGLIALGDGELKDDFAAAAHKLLGSRFVFPGFVNQSKLGRYFVAADALVMSSLYETWGLVVNEAMHYGLPVIASTQVGCVPNLVLPGQTGLVYPAKDALALARCMQRLIANPGLARQLGEAGLKLIRSYTIAASAGGVYKALGLRTPTTKSDELETAL
jgi:glycosyltransferase involved in cell wall biosynthesis